MNLTEEIIEGTLQPDRTLALDHEPQLPPGRVRVVIQVQPSRPPRRGLAAVIADIRASQLARGFSGLTDAEMKARQAEQQADEEEYEQRMQGLLSQTRSDPTKATP